MWRKTKRQTKKIIIGIIGTAVVIIGIILVPLPGPGWLVVFAGLGILSTEFTWAERLLAYGRRTYERWIRWVARQPLAIRWGIGLLTALFVVAILWLINCYGYIVNFLHLDWEWAKSPFPIPGK